MPQGAKSELDVVGYDGETIAFVEIRTRTVREDIYGRPELSVSYAKQSVLVRTTQRFPGRLPEIRLHKDAFNPQLCRSR
jgi:Holliday junction resolvase-like predicted endonuclease